MCVIIMSVTPADNTSAFPCKYESLRAFFWPHAFALQKQIHNLWLERPNKISNP